MNNVLKQIKILLGEGYEYSGTARQTTNAISSNFNNNNSKRTTNSIAIFKKEGFWDKSINIGKLSEEEIKKFITNID